MWLVTNIWGVSTHQPLQKMLSRHSRPSAHEPLEGRREVIVRLTNSVVLCTPHHLVSLWKFLPDQAPAGQSPLYCTSLREFLLLASW